jgi:phage tail-like protein
MDMFRNLSRKWVAPVAAVAVTLSVVFAVSTLRSTSPDRPTALRIHPAAAPAPVTAARFTLATDSKGTFVFSELTGITSQIAPTQYLGTTGTGIVHTKQFGKTEPPTVVLKRTLATDTVGKKLLAWHTLATVGSPNARSDANLILTDSTGKTVETFRLTNAWVSKLEISSIKAGGGTVATLTVTLTTEQIVVE